MKLVIALAVAMAVALPAGLAAQETKGASHSVITPDAVKWGPAPPFMPPGSQLAIMRGDPTKSGLFIIRGKLPDGYTIPPHWHSTDENVTVLSGVFNVGMGDKLDKSKGQALAAGGFFAAPPHMTSGAPQADVRLPIQPGATGRRKGRSPPRQADGLS
jgi:quercetin dioxygenase-like cupin family protein